MLMTIARMIGTRRAAKANAADELAWQRRDAERDAKRAAYVEALAAIPHTLSMAEQRDRMAQARREIYRVDW